MIRAFTGPSDLTRAQRVWAARRILRRRQADTWRSGCAFGLDTVAARLAGVVEADLELYIPFAEHHETLVRELAPSSKVCRCVKGRDNAHSYRIRNETMLTGLTGEPADELQAFVRQWGFYRSGEWMTINIAEKLGIKVVLEVLP